VVTSLDRSTVVLSIRPRYADRILSGTKTIEFRRRPLPKHVQSVLIWRSGPGGGIVARFTIGQQLYCGVDEFIRELDDGSDWTCEATGIAPDELIAYAGGPLHPIWAISISGLIRFPRTYTGRELGIGRAPQSWRYAHTDWRAVLGRLDAGVAGREARP
jgi:predicted transcriptional regulator